MSGFADVSIANLSGVTPEDFLGFLKRGFDYPAAGDEFERAFWCQNMLYLVSEAKIALDAEVTGLVGIIKDEKLESAEFVLEPRTRNVRSVDVGLLKSEMPEVYKQLVHISNSEAVRLLGGAVKAYELAKTMAGSRVEVSEIVNIADLKRMVMPAESERYIVTRTEVVGLPAVVRVGYFASGSEVRV